MTKVSRTSEDFPGFRVHFKAVDLNKVFLRDWRLVGGQEIPLSKEAESFGRGSSIAQIVSSGPDDYFPAIEQVYFSIITSAYLILRYRDFNGFV
ncbi:hypothetical protein RQM65_15365 [Pricia sp. S334]|uniref:Uncharacterized protein n=1 Tax=Pricia mediterranea TaxID=3076079 RepID=A0ABU3L8H4_9FLAO|nr:hypothetical protein [Pricia sp. S334]MDT7830046.1 hypothetical protein [Pricia sp. S334]